MESKSKGTKKNNEDNKLYIDFLKSCEIDHSGVGLPQQQLFTSNPASPSYKQSKTTINHTMQSTKVNRTLNMKRTRANSSSNKDNQQISHKETSFFDFLLKKHDKLHTEFEKTKAAKEEEERFTSKKAFIRAKSLLVGNKSEKSKKQHNAQTNQVNINSNEFEDNNSNNPLIKEETLKIVYRRENTVMWFKVKIVPLLLQEPLLAISLQDISQIEDEKKAKKAEQEHLFVSLSIIQKIKQHLEFMYAIITPQKIHQKLRQAIVLSLNLIRSTNSLDKSKIVHSPFALSTLIREIYSTFDQIQSIKIKVESEEDGVNNKDNNDIRTLRLCESQDESTMCRECLQECLKNCQDHQGIDCRCIASCNHLNNQQNSYNQFDFDEGFPISSPQEFENNDFQHHSSQLQQEQQQQPLQQQHQQQQYSGNNMIKYNLISVDRVISLNQINSPFHQQQLQQNNQEPYSIHSKLLNQCDLGISQNSDNVSSCYDLRHPQSRHGSLIRSTSSNNYINNNNQNCYQHHPLTPQQQQQSQIKQLTGKVQSHDNLLSNFSQHKRFQNNATGRSNAEKKKSNLLLLPVDQYQLNKLKLSSHALDGGENQRTPEVFLFPNSYNANFSPKSQQRQLQKKYGGSLDENPIEESEESNINKNSLLSRNMDKLVASSSIPENNILQLPHSAQKMQQSQLQQQQLQNSCVPQSLVSPAQSQIGLLQDELESNLSYHHKLEQDIPSTFMPASHPFPNNMGMNTYVALRSSTNLTGSEVGNQLIADFECQPQNQSTNGGQTHHFQQFQSQTNEKQYSQQTQQQQQQQPTQPTNDIILTNNYRLIFLALSGLISTFVNSKIDILIKIQHKKLYSSIKFTMKPSQSAVSTSPIINRMSSDLNNQIGTTSARQMQSVTPSVTPSQQQQTTNPSDLIKIQQISHCLLPPPTQTQPEQQSQLQNQQQSKKYQVLFQYKSLPCSPTSNQYQYQQKMQQASFQSYQASTVTSQMQPASSRKTPPQQPLFSSQALAINHKMGGIPKSVSVPYKQNLMLCEDDFMKNVYGLNYSQNKLLCVKIWKMIKDIAALIGPESIDISPNQAEIEFFLDMNVINCNSPQGNSKAQAPQTNEMNQGSYIKPSRNSLFNTHGTKENQNNNSLQQQQQQYFNSNLTSCPISPNNSNHNLKQNHNVSQNSSYQHLLVELPVPRKTSANFSTQNHTQHSIIGQQQLQSQQQQQQQQNNNTSINNMNAFNQENSVNFFAKHSRQANKKIPTIIITTNVQNMNTTNNINNQNSSTNIIFNNQLIQEENEPQSQLAEREMKSSSISISQLSLPTYQEEGFQKIQIVRNFLNQPAKFQEI